MTYKTQAEQFLDSDNIATEPPRPCHWKIGNEVWFTNDHGIEFGPYKVLGFTKPEDELHGRIIYINSESPWFPVRPDELSPTPRLPPKPKPKNPQDLTNDELLMLVETIYDEMYRERDNEAEEKLQNTIVIRLNPNKQRKHDMAEFLDNLFLRWNLRPTN